MHKTVIASMLGAVMVMMAGCATTAPEGETTEEHLARLGYRQGEALESIRRYDISGWGYIDRQHITLNGGPRRTYLISFRRPCNNLAFDNTLAYSTTAGSLTRLDRITSVSTGGFSEHCLIDRIYRLEKVDESQD